VTVGDSQRREIASYGVAPLEKIEPIRLGLELAPFLQAESHAGELRAELGLATERLVGIVARLVPIKAHEDFLNAAVAVRAANRETVFLVIGDGERRPDLEALTCQLGLTDVVRFLGWRRDLPRVYADLDVVALSSHNEGSPVSLIEALAAARAVVATAVGGVPEVVVDGETGLTIPSAQPARLADAIVRLLHDPPLAARLGAAGRRHVYPRYDSSRLVDDMRKLYLRELNARGRPVPSVGATAW
jgi:glycosyltransferase involved in cell wall biosynthesis